MRWTVDLSNKALYHAHAIAQADFAKIDMSVALLPWMQRIFAFFAANAMMNRMEETSVQCPTCGEYFSVMGPSWDELPAEWDYDCEICCRPMILVFDESGGYARGLGE